MDAVSQISARQEEAVAAQPRKRKSVEEARRALKRRPAISWPQAGASGLREAMNPELVSQLVLSGSAEPAGE